MVAKLVGQKEKTHHVSWLQALADALHVTDRVVDPSLRTTISGHMEGEKASLFLPPEMSIRQPETLRYLHAFASHNGFRLVEDRRSVDIQPIIEQRQQSSPAPMALGVSMMLKQTGLPGPIRDLSKPHRLDLGSPHIEMTQLIEMASTAVPKSKRVVILPNQFIVEALGNNTDPVVGHACHLVSGDVVTVLSYFESPAFKAIGYSAEKQIVIHVLLAGGPQRAPLCWTNLHTFGDGSCRFQLFRSNHPGHDFGLFYKTFYIDLESTGSQIDPMSEKADTHEYSHK